MKRWEYYLFLCVASGFLYVGVDQIHAEEVTPLESQTEQASETDSVVQSETVNETVSTTTISTTENGATLQDIEYQSHIQGVGWETEEHANGEVSGTQGECRRLEAVKIILPDHNNSLQYQVHVQNIGWMDYVSGGEVAGTTGQAKRIEAIRIQLLGNLANTYNVIYRTHVQNYGWMRWVMNNSLSGTTGQSLRIEAIEILLAKKDVEAAAGNDVVYDSHVQNIGWQEPVTNGEIAGTTGQAKRIEAFHISLKNQTISGQILYQAHVAGTGWQDWVTTGELAGTTGQSRQIEAIRIKLNNDLAERYDIYYRVHAQGYGWLTWTCDGLTAGTTGLSKRIEALQIRLVARENEKPENDSSISAKPAYISSNQVVTNIDQSVNFTMADKISTLLNKSGWTLRGSYDWIVNNIKYQHMVSNAALGSDWYAQYGYNHKSGNCYVYAGLMYKMGKLLGYDIHQVSGHHQTLYGLIEHSWDEIILNNSLYILDPDFQYELGRNGYLLKYGQSGTLKIMDHYRMN